MPGIRTQGIVSSKVRTYSSQSPTRGHGTNNTSDVNISTINARSQCPDRPVIFSPDSCCTFNHISKGNISSVKVPASVDESSAISSIVKPQCENLDSSARSEQNPPNISKGNANVPSARISRVGLYDPDSSSSDSEPSNNLPYSRYCFSEATEKIGGSGGSKKSLNVSATSKSINVLEAHCDCVLKGRKTFLFYLIFVNKIALFLQKIANFFLSFSPNFY